MAIVVLPGLVAGASIDAPPLPGEIVRLQGALDPAGPSGSSGSEVARQFFVSTLANGAILPTEPARKAEVVSRARLAQCASVLGLGLLVYVAVLLARGRLQALLACCCLAALPPVAVEGYVLRPETPAALFTVLALVLLQCLAQPQRGRGHHPAWRRALFVFGLSLCTTAATALAVAALPSIGECLLVPGIVLTVAAVQLGLRSLRIGRRIGFLRVPIRSINHRLLPWTATALLAPAMALILLSAAAVPVDTLPATTSAVALLPANAWGRGLVVVVALVGTLAGVLRVGLRFGRRGRIGADLVLLIFCAVFLASAAGAPTAVDSLPGAPAMAVMLSEGARLCLLLLRSAVARVLGGGSP